LPGKRTGSARRSRKQTLCGEFAIHRA